MKLGVLTSSRADFGIYLPLLRQLERDSLFKVEIIAFGTHLSHFHGFSFQHIRDENFQTVHSIESLILGDSKEAVSTAMGLTTVKFASFWKNHHFDLVFCLGDRYEMFAAVAAAIPFNQKFAHLHGGEVTAGAIDDIFRHCITLASWIHFCSTSDYEKRICQLLNSSANVFNVGALSLDNLLDADLYSKDDFQNRWNIDLSIPTILVTLHPETKTGVDNAMLATVLSNVIKTDPKYQFVITMPNADSQGNEIRKVFQNQLANLSKVRMIENFGTRGYFSCLKYCSLMMGNSSSGIIEAASLGTYVINLGTRQQGRAKSANVFDVSFDVEAIKNCISMIEKLPSFSGENVYWQGGAAKKIIDVLKSFHGRISTTPH